MDGDSLSRPVSFFGPSPVRPCSFLRVPFAASLVSVCWTSRPSRSDGRGIHMGNGNGRAAVREMEYAIDATDDRLGMTRIEVEPERTPAERLALRIINDHAMHSHGNDVQWWRLSHTGEIGKVRAEATKRKWERREGPSTANGCASDRRSSARGRATAGASRSPTTPTGSRNHAGTDGTAGDTHHLSVAPNGIRGDGDQVVPAPPFTPRPSSPHTGRTGSTAARRRSHTASLRQIIPDNRVGETGIGFQSSSNRFPPHHKHAELNDREVETIRIDARIDCAANDDIWRI